jgi:hypothetical protein
VKNQVYAGYAWANFGPKTNDQVMIDFFVCEGCLTENEKKEFEPQDDFLTVDLPDEGKNLCNRCGKVL